MSGVLELGRDAPEWARNMAFAIQRALLRLEVPEGPPRAWVARTLNDLPRPASKYPYRCGVCLDVGGGVTAWVFTDASDWRRADTGAVI